MTTSRGSENGKAKAKFGRKPIWRGRSGRRGERKEGRKAGRQESSAITNDLTANAFRARFALLISSLDREPIRPASYEQSRYRKEGSAVFTERRSAKVIYKCPQSAAKAAAAARYNRTLSRPLPLTTTAATTTAAATQPFCAGDSMGSSNTTAKGLFAAAAVWFLLTLSHPQPLSSIPLPPPPPPPPPPHLSGRGKSSSSSLAGLLVLPLIAVALLGNITAG